MLWLYIVGGILLVILALLFSPVVVRVTYSDTLVITAKVWGLLLYEFPEKVKPMKTSKFHQKVNRVTKRLKPKTSEMQFLIDQFGLLETVKIFIAWFAALPGAIVRFARGGRLRKFKLHISASGNDAADTAVLYGQVCTLVYPVLGALDAHTKVIRPDIQVMCDYSGKPSEFYVDGKLYVSVYHALAVVVGVLKDMIAKNL